MRFMAVDKSRTREEWFVLAKEMVSSSRTQQAWREEHDISITAMRSYLRRSRLDLLKPSEEKSKGESSCWIEASGSSSETSHDIAPAMEVFVSPAKAKAAPNFDGTAFAEICKVLMSLC
jgi:hypothetical protein